MFGRTYAIPITQVPQNKELTRRYPQGGRGVLLAAPLAALLLAGCRSTPPPMPLDQLNAQQTAGHAVFQARCALCHYDRQTGSLNGPSLLGVFKKPALPSGAAATDERVTSTIVHGRNNMPALGNQLDPSDIADVLAYLHTL